MITPAQKLARATRIGSSDAPAILGLDPRRSAADVFLEKTGRADGFAGNDATDRGNWLEPALIAFAVDRIGPGFTPDQMFLDATAHLCANLDAVNADLTQAIEAKSTVIEEGYGEEGTDQVPDRVNAQVAHQFAVVPTLQTIWVPVVIPAFMRFDFRLYRVERNEQLAQMVAAAGVQFMREHVLPAVPPSDFKPSIEVLRRVRREPNKIIPVADEILDNFITARAAVKQAQEAREAAEAELLTALGDAEQGEGTATIATYLQTKRKAYAVAESTYRCLRTKTKRGASK